MTSYKCITCRDTGCKDGRDHSGSGAGVIGPDPEPCIVCNPDDITGQVKHQTLLANEWNRGLSSYYFSSTAF